MRDYRWEEDPRIGRECGLLAVETGECESWVEGSLVGRWRAAVGAANSRLRRSPSVPCGSKSGPGEKTRTRARKSREDCPGNPAVCHATQRRGAIPFGGASVPLNHPRTGARPQYCRPFALAALPPPDPPSRRASSSPSLFSSLPEQPSYLAILSTTISRPQGTFTSRRAMYVRGSSSSPFPSPAVAIAVGACVRICGRARRACRVAEMGGARRRRKSENTLDGAHEPPVGTHHTHARAMHIHTQAPHNDSIANALGGRHTCTCLECFSSVFLNSFKPFLHLPSLQIDSILYTVSAPFLALITAGTGEPTDESDNKRLSR